MKQILDKAFNGNNTAVVLSSDDTYAKYLSVTVQSIIENSTKGNNYDIIIFDGGIKEETKEKILSQAEGVNNCSIRFFDIESHLKDFDISIFHITNHFTLATYFRFFIPEVLSKFSRCLYLDCDLVVNCDIAELHNMDFEGASLIATKDHVAIYTKYGRNKNEYFSDVLKIDKYQDCFQAGVLVYNVDKMIKNNDCKRLIEKLLEIKKPLLVDQDVMNSLYVGDVKLINVNWNYIWHLDFYPLEDEMPLDLCELKKDLKIIHFASEKKPWHINRFELSKYFWKYAKPSPFYDDLVIEYRTLSLEDVKKMRRKRLKYLKYSILQAITFSKVAKLKNKKLKYKHAYHGLLKDIATTQTTIAD